MSGNDTWVFPNDQHLAWTSLIYKQNMTIGELEPVESAEANTWGAFFDSMDFLALILGQHAVDRKHFHCQEAAVTTRIMAKDTCKGNKSLCGARLYQPSCLPI